ncbi:GNAT family N-acetyltransferase [Plantactinospora sonchi]|uniref:GNAT family N-acetyltransferase n=1 Tax=Plantactinospora sonchi TaxID=1544735 RepID=A0ABU7RWA2_9ACTN
MPTDHRTRIAERGEAELIFQFGTLAPESAHEALGITTGRIGGGVVLSVRDDPMGGFWNRALGLGLTEPVTARLIGEIVDFHRANGSPSATIQIAPEVLPSDWDEITARYGLTVGGTWVKLAGSIDDLRPDDTRPGTPDLPADRPGPGPRTDLRVGPVTPEHVDEWSALVWQIFAGRSDEHLTSIMASGARRGAFQGFAAWDGDTMVGVANLYVCGDIGHLNSGATLESHRRHGVQSALIAARARAAAEAGCRWLVAETGRPERPGSNPSLNNMVRAGLTPLYERNNWIWRPEAGTNA